MQSVPRQIKPLTLILLLLFTYFYKGLFFYFFIVQGDLLFGVIYLVSTN